jgi:hypothetical protein
MSEVGRIPSAGLRRFRRLMRRPGMTVLVVMALISIALAMSYSIMRSQMTGIQLQANSDRRNMARQAALAGMNAAMRNMRLSAWSGVGVPLTASLNSTDSYSVSFTAGDSTLVAGAAAYSEYPYRVTVISTGTSVDPAHSTVSSTYRVKAVMRLIPRQTSANPSNWSTLMSYVVYQLAGAETYLALPCHIDGPVRLQDRITLDDPYNWATGPRNRYFSDLAAMRGGVNAVQTLSRGGIVTGGTFTLTYNGATTGNLAYNVSSSSIQTALQNLSTIGSGNVTVTSGGTGVWVVTFGGQLAAKNLPNMTVNTSNLTGVGASLTCTTTSPGAPGSGDYRQFSGPISVPTSKVTSTNTGLLTGQLGLTLNNISQTSTTPPPVSSAVNYRLYPGGALYNFAQLPASATNVTLTPDPVTNPMGIFYNSGSATLGSNVTITGTVFSGGDLVVTGTNVHILPYNLQAVEGSTTPIRLPAVMSLGNFRVATGANATINGTMYAAQKFLVDDGVEATALAITGNVIVGVDIRIGERNEWENYGSWQWDVFNTLFSAQLSANNAIPFFPQWMATYQGRNCVPLLTLKLDSTPVVAQWQNMSNPLYVVGSSDSGLHWDLVSWTDNL